MLRVNNLHFKKGECNNIKSQGMLVQFSQNGPLVCGYCSCSLKSCHACCGTIRVIVELTVRPTNPRLASMTSYL